MSYWDIKTPNFRSKVVDIVLRYRTHNGFIRNYMVDIIQWNSINENFFCLDGVGGKIPDRESPGSGS